MNIFYARATRFAFLLVVISLTVFGFVDRASAVTITSIDTTNTPNQGENALLDAIGTRVLAQSFTTDATGGTLETMILQDSYINPFTTGYDVRIYTAALDGTIGTSYATFESTANHSGFTGMLSFVPTSPVTLDGNTTYWVVTKGPITWKIGNNTNTGTGSIPATHYRAISTDSGANFSYDENANAGGDFGTGAWKFNMKITYTSAALPDTTAPTLVSISPTNGATNVVVDTNIVLTFDEAVYLGSGLITLGTNGNSALVENITVTGGQVSGDGTDTITINPAFDIIEGTEVFVNIPNTAFRDAAGNYYAGISAGSAPRFTIIDNTAPVLTEVTPLSGKLPKDAEAVYRYTTNETCDIQATSPTSTTGPVEVLAEEVIVGEVRGITLQGTKPGGTYSFTFNCVDASNNQSNTLVVGPFTVYKASSSAGGYASVSSLAKQGVKLENKICPADQILTQNLKAPSQNGKYNSYTKGVVKEAKILQAHLNRLGFNAGLVDGFLGPITDGAIKRMQTFLGTKPDGFVGPLTRGVINSSCNS